MKLIHLSDLHLGRRFNEVSMLEDQRYILAQIIKIIDEERPDGVMISGDIYDKTIPPAEAVQVFDEFLVKLAKRKLEVFIISGNHDSPERLTFGSRLLSYTGIHISPVYSGTVEPLTLEDQWGTVSFWLLPFIKPVHVRRFFPEQEIGSYTDAVRTALEQMQLDPAQRNVLLTHQFVTGAETCASEELSVGGTDNVDASLFRDFDYVALGHIHGPQNVGSPKIRYCGTPLKYSFSETKHRKSVTVVELLEKGNLQVRTVELKPKHDMRVLRGTYEELTAKSFYKDMDCEDYLHIVLTDEEDVPEAMGRLRTVYKNLMTLEYDNTRTRENALINSAEEVQKKSPLELFEELYEMQNNQPMSDVQKRFLTELMEKIQEEQQ